MSRKREWLDLIGILVLVAGIGGAAALLRGESFGRGAVGIFVGFGGALAILAAAAAVGGAVGALIAFATGLRDRDELLKGTAIGAGILVVGTLLTLAS